MSRTEWKTRISASPEVRHGSACFNGTRVPVSAIIGGLAEGMDTESLLAEYPQLQPSDIAAALAYAAEVLEHELLIPSEPAASALQD